MAGFGHLPRQAASRLREAVMNLQRDNVAPICPEVEQQLTRFAASAPGFLFTTRLAPDGTLSMPFASAAIRDYFGLQSADVAGGIAPRSVLSVAKVLTSGAPLPAVFR